MSTRMIPVSLLILVGTACAPVPLETTFDGIEGGWTGTYLASPQFTGPLPYEVEVADMLGAVQGVGRQLYMVDTYSGELTYADWFSDTSRWFDDSRYFDVAAFQTGAANWELSIPTANGLTLICTHAANTLDCAGTNAYGEVEVEFQRCDAYCGSQYGSYDPYGY